MSYGSSLLRKLVAVSPIYNTIRDNAWRWEMMSPFGSREQVRNCSWELSWEFHGFPRYNDGWLQYIHGENVHADGFIVMHQVNRYGAATHLRFFLIAQFMSFEYPYQTREWDEASEKLRDYLNMQHKKRSAHPVYGIVVIGTRVLLFRFAPDWIRAHHPVERRGVPEPQFGC